MLQTIQAHVWKLKNLYYSRLRKILRKFKIFMKQILKQYILRGEFIVTSIYVMKAEKPQLISKRTKSGRSNLQIGKRKERLEWK